MKTSLIVATDLAGGVGRDGTIPWRCRRDLRHFKERTHGKVVVMGRRTIESLPFKLPGRTTIMLSNSLDSHPFADEVFTGFGEVLAAFYDTPEIVWAGGEQIYEQVLQLDFVNEIWLTTILNSYDCDTFFPLRALNSFDMQSNALYAQEHEDPAFVITHFTYRKLRSSKSDDPSG